MPILEPPSPQYDPNSVDACSACEPSIETAGIQHPVWVTGWRRAFMVGIWLLYLIATASGIAQYSSGTGEIIGFVVLAGFCLGYFAIFPTPFGSRPHAHFGWIYGAMWVAYGIEIPLARNNASAMVAFLVVVGVLTFGARFLPIAGTLAVAVLVLPALVPSWHAGVDVGTAVAIVTVALAMYGFYRVTRANIELSEARAEVARLAAENERNRIARDLHDLLGHSLTTITVKAGLARRLAPKDPAGAIREITEVEELGRRSLAEVRATVSGYHDLTLTGELAAARELLRAAGIQAELPAAAEGIEPVAQSLFGWVLREGLTNVVRHSHATRCVVTLGPRTLEIVDDGVGAADHGMSGNGLRGLRERVATAGGRIDAGPGPAGGGWRLFVEVPAGPGRGPGPLAGRDPAAAPAETTPAAAPGPAANWPGLRPA